MLQADLRQAILDLARHAAPAAPTIAPPRLADASIMALDWSALLTQWSVRILGALMILLVGLWLARRIANLLERSLARFDRADPILRSFARNVVYAGLSMVVVVAALTQVGVPPASLLTVLGAAGLAIGLALKDSLSNIASGVMLMALRPFRAGDQVRISGIEGIVEQVRIFSTRLRTPQNEDILVPNSEITKAPIYNFTARPQRRVDVSVTLPFDEEIDAAQQTLLESALEVEGVLADPPPECTVTRFDELGIGMLLSAWVTTADHPRVRSDLLRRAHANLRRKGVRLASRQMLMHWATPDDPPRDTAEFP